MPFFAMDISALPFRTDRTLRRVPYVTYALCFINLFVYLALLGRSEYDLYIISCKWGFIAGKPTLVTLFTAGFLHTDLQHLMGNLLILWLVGTVLEAGIGSVIFLLLYLASLVCATLLFGLMARISGDPSALLNPLIGASGAISGVTGLAAFRYFRIRVLVVPLLMFPFLQVPIPLPVLVWVPMWAYALFFAVRELIAGFSQLHGQQSMVAHWAHIGGLLLGVLMALFMQVANEGRREFALEDSAKAANPGHEKPRERSLQEMQALLREHPDDPEILEAIAGLHLSSGEPEKSREFYLKALRLFLAGGLRDRAAITYLNILRVFPRTLLPPREQITLASTLESLGHFREAMQAFTLIIDHYAAHDEARTALLRAAQIHQRYLEDRASAERLLNLFIERYPDSDLVSLARERLRDLTQAAKK